MKKIYVQIPAYRDIELGATLLDLVEKADDADALRIGVLWQRAEGDTLPEAVHANPNTEIIEQSYQESKGCNWARAELQKRWQGEPYTLFLDSHHRFIPGWDRHLIEMHEGLKQSGIQKPLITAYLPPYDPRNDPDNRLLDPLQIWAHSREQGMLIYLIAQPIPMWRTLENPIPARFASLHFVFAEGTFNREIVLDEQVYFFGDEVVLALRAFTHGYDLFHPHYVLGWHLYDRVATRTTHWEDHSDYHERNERSCNRLRDIFLGIDDEAIGTARSLDEYEFLICDKLIRC
ncbi:GlcNAc-transferase family protein [Leptolyngbya ohadii]|uniref:GlcNAc-transferase family protein n=1 Tax=Leptolyngbya ohadii TaxID=1962290 RepID=UPI000B59D410|nr:GlcNAc-transferase family protein [Leptolyngbya ohadii]